MGLRNWLFGTGESDEDGCTSHHFEDYRPLTDFRCETRKLYKVDWSKTTDGPHNTVKTEWLAVSLVPDSIRGGDAILDGKIELKLQQKQKATCEHQGCLEHDFRYRTVKTITLDEIDEFDD